MCVCTCELHACLCACKLHVCSSACTYAHVYVCKHLDVLVQICALCKCAIMKICTGVYVKVDSIFADILNLPIIVCLFLDVMNLFCDRVDC